MSATIHHTSALWKRRPFQMASGRTSHGARVPSQIRSHISLPPPPARNRFLTPLDRHRYDSSNSHCPRRRPLHGHWHGHSHGHHRTFFASSRDFTDLLAYASVHCIPGDASNDGDGTVRRQTYILLADGTPLDLAIRVDKLQLARLHVETTTATTTLDDGNGCRHRLYGARVLQRTLGEAQDVCRPLLEKALRDLRSSSSSSSPVVTASASLDGLCKWIAAGNGTHHGTGTGTAAETVTSYANERDPVAMAEWYRADEALRLAWEELSAEYVTEAGLSGESNLYLTQAGATYDGIDHLADPSNDGMLSAGGAVARFKLE